MPADEVPAGGPGRLSPTPRRRLREEGAGRGRRGGGGKNGIVFLVAGALPAAAVAWFFLQPEATRRELLEKIPSGVGGRALAAGVALVALLVLARVALPAFHGASGALKRMLSRFEERKGVMRVVLFPAEAVVWTLWLLAQLLFAVDAALVVAAGLLMLLLAIRIVKPDLLPSVLPELTQTR